MTKVNVLISTAYGLKPHHKMDESGDNIKKPAHDSGRMNTYRLDIIMADLYIENVLHNEQVLHLRIF